MPISRLGVTVLPEYFQSEGIEAVLDNLTGRLGANAVTTSPYVAAEAGPEDGSREPPVDAGSGKTRKLDRPLWGKDEVWMKTSPSFAPTPSHYIDTPYRPDPATDLTRAEGPMVGHFLDAAKARGMKTYLQVMAAIPPSYRVQFGGPVAADQPMMPDGRPVQTGSTAMPPWPPPGCAITWTG